MTINRTIFKKRNQKQRNSHIIDCKEKEALMLLSNLQHSQWLMEAMMSYGYTRWSDIRSRCELSPEGKRKFI